MQIAGISSQIQAFVLGSLLDMQVALHVVWGGQQEALSGMSFSAVIRYPEPLVIEVSNCLTDSGGFEPLQTVGQNCLDIF